MSSLSKDLKRKDEKDSSLLRLKVRGIPNASKTEIVGCLGDALKVKIQAPADKGRANEKLIHYLATLFKMPQKNITIVSGETARLKIVEINCITLNAKQRIQKDIEAFVSKKKTF